jgi:hypothetical protein
MNRPSPRFRILFALTIASASAALAIAACSSSDGGGGVSAAGDGAAPAEDAPSRPDSYAPPADARSDAPADAGKDATPDVVAKDANGPGEAGATCSFNRDCNAALRCECDEVNGCACKPGARGTGQNGIDKCDSGNQCASSLCVEGPAGVYYCSDECASAAECTGALPVCANIAFVGKICIRQGG